MDRRKTAPVLLATLLAAGMGAAPATGAPIFGDGFEDCCTVGGTVSGLAGSGLVLRLSAGAVIEDRAIAASGPFSFTTPLAEGVAWIVSVHSPPASGPSCQVANPGGTIGTQRVTDVAVNCGAALQWDDGDWGDLWQ